MSDDFLKRLEGTLKEDRRPKLGIWYYLWLKPEWKLWHYEYTDVDKNLSHYEAWQVLAVDVAKHYGITDQSKIDALKEAYLCMPRGRVDSSQGLNLTSTVEWYGIFHGNDFPKPQSAEVKKIIGLFDLTSLLFAEKVRVIQVEHEMMDSDHQNIAKGILGEIPY